MDTHSIVVAAFKAFARYAPREGVLKNFTSGRLEGYSALKSFCQSMPQDSVIGGITDYVFGVNEESVAKRIATVKGTYLFVDYGHLETAEDKYKVKTDSWNLAVTVADPMAITKPDLVDEVLLADRLLNITRRIRIDLLTNREDCFTRLLTFPSEITPWHARELQNSIGWTMLFKLKSVDMLGELI